jgi:hypothetical protein
MSTEQPLAEKLPANTEHAAPTPWIEGRQRLEAGRWYWLTTVRPDGRPHVMPVLAVWLEGALFFVAADASRKAHNLARDAHCVMTVALEDAHLVVEGEAARVKDESRLQRVAHAYAEKYAWPVTVRNAAFDADFGAPTAGPPPYAVYELTPSTAFGFGTDETFSPTRWRF